MRFGLSGTTQADAAGAGAAPGQGFLDFVEWKLEVLRAAGATNVLASFAGSRESLRRFAREIVSAFSA